MNDPLLKKLMRSWQFQHMSKQEQMLELQDYHYQSETSKGA